MINIQGYFSGANGWSRHATGFVCALNKYRELRIKDWGCEGVPENSSSRISQLFNQLNESAKVGIGMGPMECMHNIIGLKKIAFSVWETSLIPADKLNSLGAADEIWVPSKWGRENLIQNGVSSDMIKIIPEGVDTEQFYPDMEGKKENEKEDDPFRFLCVGKWGHRKGIEDLLKVYCTTFSKSDNVELHLHVYNPYIMGFDIGKIETTVDQDYPNHAAIFYAGQLSDNEMRKLYSTTDIFVLPTRGEGWGLPIIESMACRTPVMVTNYGGHTEFVNEQNSFLIEVDEMIKADDPYAFDPRIDYGVWAQPNLGHLSYLMRYAFDHPDEVLSKGHIAFKDVSSNWTWDHAAQKANVLL